MRAIASFLKVIPESSNSLLRGQAWPSAVRRSNGASSSGLSHMRHYFLAKQGESDAISASGSRLHLTNVDLDSVLTEPEFSRDFGVSRSRSKERHEPE